MWPHNPADTQTLFIRFLQIHTCIPCCESRTSSAFLLEHKNWNAHRNCCWPLFLIRPYSRTTAPHWGVTGTSMYCSVTEQPRGASPTHPKLSRCASLAWWEIHGKRPPHANLLWPTNQCAHSRVWEGGATRASVLSLGPQYWRLIIEAVIANGQATCASGA